MAEIKRIRLTVMDTWRYLICSIEIGWTALRDEPITRLHQERPSGIQGPRFNHNGSPSHV